jgi:hypothetical protein
VSDQHTRIHELVAASRRRPWLRHVIEWLPIIITIISFIVAIAGAEMRGFKRGYFSGVHDGITLRAAATGGDPV